MDMSAAALPARCGSYSKVDEQHPLFPLYRQYRSSMTVLMVDSSDFRDWLYQHERQQRDEVLMQHTRFKEFQQWMRDVQGGRSFLLPDARQSAWCDLSEQLPILA